MPILLAAGGHFLSCAWEGVDSRTPEWAWGWASVGEWCTGHFRTYEGRGRAEWQAVLSNGSTMPRAGALSARTKVQTCSSITHRSRGMAFERCAKAKPFSSISERARRGHWPRAFVGSSEVWAVLWRGFFVFCSARGRNIAFERERPPDLLDHVICVICGSRPGHLVPYVEDLVGILGVCHMRRA